ncbi:Saposin-like type B [Macleaya cordata]|uniref:Pulmonary surfactant-associated protein B n=1 Tax=Macleaya cordata TaxID=56857 RepID=A0A200QQC0_MACCD|nr:Saposin-like type B [Macleaya cordata]
MGVKGGLLFLLVLGVSWIFVDARSLPISDVSNVTNDRVCTLCEQFTAEAITYLGENKTQTEIINTLHLACSRMLSFKQECLTLVDYYAPLFFLEMATIQPGDFCEKMNLCDEQFPNGCKMCHQAIEEVMDKLEDPDTQLEIMEILLKACNAEKKYAKRCKRLVFEYGPLIMVNAEQYLAARDICTSIHICKASTDGIEEASSTAKTSLLAES